MATEEMTLFDSSNGEKPFVVGKMATTFFSSPDSFYKVMLVTVSETNTDWHEKEIVVTGNFAEVEEGKAYRFTGRLVDHPRYGKQFQAENYHAEVPTSRTGLLHYLQSDTFSGIGAKTAEKIVDALGENAIEAILKNPDVLDPIGLTEKQKGVLVEAIQMNNGMEQIIIGLNGYGFGSQLAAEIYGKYKQRTLNVIHETPYRLAEEINGVSFKRADQIAAQLGFEPDSPGRLRAGLLQTLNNIAMQNGDTYTSARPLITQTLEMLEQSQNVAIDPEKLATQLLELAKDQKVVGDADRIYLTNMYNAEWQSAEHLQRILAEEDMPQFSDEEMSKAIRIIERQNDILYDDSQENAMKQMMNAHVFLLTGGPGTGKTTIINGIASLYARLHDVSLDINQYTDKPFPILFAAPTGRAAKRMAETTGLPASTIHRLLGLNGRENPADEEGAKDLEGGLIIVDEASMIDIFLLRSLLKAIPSTMQVAFVGDMDQLPSVGPGQVFHDLLASNLIPKVELTSIYRQDAKSSIIPLAHSIRDGQLPADFTQNQSDRSFFNCRPDQVAPLVEKIVKRAMDRGFTADDIQVLAPMYRGPAGVNRLNTVVQDILNPKKDASTKELIVADTRYRIGDKVLHLVNSPEDNVFNGDIGRIVGINLQNDKKNAAKTDQIIVAYDGNEVTYARQDFTRITLAYCMSVHKSQGSEFKMVLLPLVMQFSRMLQRNLLYTAITRAADMLIMLGDPSAFEESVQHESANRKTTLIERFKQVLNPGEASTEIPAMTTDQTTTSDDRGHQNNEVTDDEAKSQVDETPVLAKQDYHLTNELVAAGQIDPMIGMNQVKPQDLA